MEKDTKYEAHQTFLKKRYVQKNLCLCAARTPSLIAKEY